MIKPYNRNTNLGFHNLPNQSSGILDDFAVRKVVEAQEYTIAKAMTFINSVDTGLIIDSARTFWPFKYASGLGIDNTGCIFDVATSSIGFKVLNNFVWYVETDGDCFIIKDLDVSGNTVTDGSTTTGQPLTIQDAGSDTIVMNFTGPSGTKSVEVHTDTGLIDWGIGSTFTCGSVTPSDGATGSFTTVDGKNVTVVSGIITSIV